MITLSSSPTLGHLSRGIFKSESQEDICSHVYCGLIHNSQDVKNDVGVCLQRSGLRKGDVYIL